MSDVEEVLNGLVDVPQAEAATLLEAGYLYIEMGNFPAAEDVFAGVAALLPESDVPHLALGNLYFAQGKFKRALKHHEDALSTRPESAVAQAHIGECLLWLKRSGDAVAALEKSLEMEPSGVAADFAKALLDAHRTGELTP